TRVRLQPKPTRVLCALVEKPGAIVTREDLCRRLWPDGTFVDFESGVNTAVNRLRLALNDSAEQPRYIETMSRTGYRFIAPVTLLTNAAVAETPVPALLEIPKPSRRIRPRSLAIAALILCAIAAPVFWLATPSRQVRFQQATFRRGQVGGARFVPGKQD